MHRAVVTVRERPREYKNGADVDCLFRSYNHRSRDPPEPKVYNPRDLSTAKLHIHEACRATTAAPLYFKKFLLRNRRYMDGGVSSNNPTKVAYYEARDMIPNRGANPQDPPVMISIGTGKSKEYSKFTKSGLLFWARNKLVDTEGVHEEMTTTLRHIFYRRLNVTEHDADHDFTGLGSIKLDACRRQRATGHFPWSKTRTLENGDIELEAMENDNTGDYDPTKYRYKTFDEIRRRTLQFCDFPATRQDIKACASKLDEISEGRRNDDHERWQQFRRHPHPDYQA